MKKILLLLLPLVVIFSSSCVSIEERYNKYLSTGYFYSSVEYKTNTSDIRHIVICNVSNTDANFRYVYKHKYVIGYDTVKVVADSTIYKYIIERYNYDNTETETIKLSQPEYEEFLIESRYNYKHLSDTTILYKDWIWDKRVLDEMYNRYID